MDILHDFAVRTKTRPRESRDLIHSQNLNQADLPNKRQVGSHLFHLPDEGYVSRPRFEDKHFSSMLLNSFEVTIITLKY